MNDLPITLTLPGGSGVQEGMGYDASSRLVTETLAGPSANTLGYTPVGDSLNTYFAVPVQTGSHRPSVA